MRKKILIILFFLLSISIVSANQEFGIERNFLTNDTKIIEEIKIQNNLDKEIELVIKEIIPSNVEYLGDKEILIEYYDALEVENLLLNLTIQPLSSSTVYNEFNAYYVGRVGFLPLQVYYDGKVVRSKKISLEIPCNSNSICEPSLGENFYICSQDCSSGSQDYVCDMINDDICDPDCLEGDSDCKEFCGDNICQETETDLICPSDCRVLPDIKFVVFYEEKGFWNYLVLYIFTFLVFILQKFSPIKRMHNIFKSNKILLNLKMENNKIQEFSNLINSISFFHISLFLSLIFIQIYLIEDSYSLIFYLISFLFLTIIYVLITNIFLKSRFLSFSFILKLCLSIVTYLIFFLILMHTFNSYIQLEDRTVFIIQGLLLMLMLILLNFNLIKILSIGFEKSKLRIFLYFCVFIICQILFFIVIIKDFVLG